MSHLYAHPIQASKDQKSKTQKPNLLLNLNAPSISILVLLSSPSFPILFFLLFVFLILPSVGSHSSLSFFFWFSPHPLSFFFWFSPPHFLISSSFSFSPLSHSLFGFPFFFFLILPSVGSHSSLSFFSFFSYFSLLFSGSLLSSLSFPFSFAAQLPSSFSYPPPFASSFFPQKEHPLLSFPLKEERRQGIKKKNPPASLHVFLSYSLKKTKAPMF